MLAYLKQLKTRFDALQPRERILIVVAVAALIYMLADLLLLVPELKKQKALQEQIAAQQVELDGITVASAQFASHAARDTLAPERAERDRLRNIIAEADQMLEQANTSSPQVGALIRTMLDANPGLTLVSLRTLPVTSFFTAKSVPATPAPNAKPDAGASAPLPPLSVFRHGVEISIKGNYLALLPYLENLQRYPRRLFWYDAKLDVATYPDAILRMTIYTLSEQSSSPLG